MLMLAEVELVCVVEKTGCPPLLLVAEEVTTLEVLKDTVEDVGPAFEEDDVDTTLPAYASTRIAATRDLSYPSPLKSWLSFSLSWQLPPPTPFSPPKKTNPVQLGLPGSTPASSSHILKQSLNVFAAC
jgi:hypothetical protein